MINSHESEQGWHEEPRRGNLPETNAGGEPMVRKPEIAKRLEVTERTIENYMRLRRIPFVKNGRLVYFKVSEVERALFRKVEARPQLDRQGEAGRN